MNYVFVLALGIGIVAGLRSLTAPAVVVWALVGARLGYEVRTRVASNLQIKDVVVAVCEDVVAVGLALFLVSR